MYSPTFSERDETAATCAIASLLETGTEFAFKASTAVATAVSIPRRMPIGFAPAVTFLGQDSRSSCSVTSDIISF